MRDYGRHPEPNSPDLGARCLYAVTLDDRLDDRVREQAGRLLALCQDDPIISVAPLQADGRRAY